MGRYLAFVIVVPCFLLVFAMYAKQKYDRSVDERLARSDLCKHGALMYGDDRWDLSVDALPHAEMLARHSGRPVDFTPLTDASLRDLLRLSKVSRLDLHGRPITDAAIPYLKELRRLEVLDLRDTHVTERGIAVLKDALPSCKIVQARSATEVD